MSVPSSGVARSTMRRVALGFAFWTAIGLVFALSRLAQTTHEPRVLERSLVEWWTWGLLTPAIVFVARTLRSLRQPPWLRLAMHVVAGTLTAFVYVGLEAIVSVVVGLVPWSAAALAALPAVAVQSIFWNVLVYALIVGVWEAHASNQRYLSAELQMERLHRNFSEARLSALRTQLDPHFVFNTLNTISAVVVSDPMLARDMIEHLGDLLRLSLDPERRQTSTLADELALLDHYVAIQKIRFGDALRFESDVAPELLHARVPSLFIQPLVENAIRHGLSSRARGGSVRVVAQSADAKLDIRVLDDGVGLPADWTLEDSAGLGLGITRERIAGLYPEGSTSFAVRRRTSGGTEIAISVPIDRAPAP